MFGSPNRPLSPQVPQRMAAAQGGPEDGGGAPGVWGAWGPWSACSRSCSGGVMEQTRPCLPGSYRSRGGRQPGAPARAFAGHVVSAVRTSVPLHRSREQPRATAGLDARRQGPALRGSRNPLARGREPTAERRYTTSGIPPAQPCPHSCPCLDGPCALSCRTDCTVNALLLPGGEELLAPRVSFHLWIHFAAF